MSVDVRSMLLAKNEKKHNDKLMLKNVNRSLIVALLAIPVYGKEARDEEIMSVIINAGHHSRRDALMAKMRENYNQMLKDKKIKKVKGEVRNTDGFIVLVPRE